MHPKPNCSTPRARRLALACWAVGLLATPQCIVVGAGEAPVDESQPGDIETKAKVSGSLNRHDVRDTVRDHIDEVRSCYNRALHRRPELSGSLTIAASVQPTGRVGSCELAASNLDDPELESCIVHGFAQWRFPAAKGSTQVRYPFALSAD